MTGEPSAYADRVRSLVSRYRADRAAFAETWSPADAPDEARAMEFLREGVGPAVMIYVDARANDWGVEFAQWEFDLLHSALNGYLELYARCYGVEIDADFAVREAAELLIDTHNVRDVAAMLTSVPDGTAAAD